MPLPDVDISSWNKYSADRWKQQTEDRIKTIGTPPPTPAMPSMPAMPRPTLATAPTGSMGLDFLASSSQKIRSLMPSVDQPPQMPTITPPVVGPGGIQLPPIPIPQIPGQQQIPGPQQLPQPVPQLPTPSPTPVPVSPQIAPAPPVELPVSGAPPVPPPQAPAPEQAPPPGLPTPQTPQTPQTPLTPGPAPAAPPRSIYAPDTATTPPQQSPFADQTTTSGGPFADQAQPTTVTTPQSAGPSGAIPAQINVPIDSGPTISRAQAEGIVAGTPLEGLGSQIWDLGVKYNVDPAFALSIAKNESNYGSTPLQQQNNNVWDISNAAYGGQAVQGSRWGQYPDKLAAAEAFYKLITQEYYPKGQTTVGSVMWGPNGTQVHAYAPTSENSTEYPDRLINTMRGYGAQIQPGAQDQHAPATPRQTPGTQIANTPNVNGQIFPLPIRPDNAPTATYHSEGGSDLMAPRGTPVLNMQGGTVDEVFTDNGSHTVGGNAVLIRGDDGLDYYYAHFDQPTSLKVGQRVGAGEQIGAVGNSGNAWKGGDGATHLHIGIGHGISDGIGSEGGLGQHFNAQTLLTDLEPGVGQATTTGPAPAASPLQVLDQTRKAISDSLAGRPVSTPIRPQIADLGITAASPQAPQAYQDYAQPQRQQDQQRPQPYAPAMMSAPGTGGSGSPFDQIGKSISDAIQQALGGLGGGGGPKRTQYQPEDQPANQDQSVGDRSRAMIERFNQLPGGHTLQDLGMPDLLPPDFSGKSPGDAVLAALGAAGRQALNRQSPTLGPGGLGIYDPRLGADPRQEVPPILDPAEAIGEILSRIRGQRGFHALEDAFSAARSETPLGAGSVAGAPVSGGGTGPALAAMARDGEKSIVSTLDRNGLQGFWDSFVRQYSDRNVDLNHIEEELGRRLGRPLQDNERLALLARVDPTHQAATATEMAIGPSLRAVPQEALPDTYDLIKHRTNLSIAEGLAKQEGQRVIDAGIAPNTEARMQSAMEDWNKAQDAVDEAQRLRDEASYPGGLQTRESISMDAANRRVQAAQDQLDAAAEVARQTNADAARERTLAAPTAGNRLVTHPELRDLTIAENNAKVLNQKYSKLFGTDPEHPYLETLGRQVGRAEDRAARLRSQIGEASGTRSATIEGRAQAASDAAFTTQPRYNPTADYAGANVRLRYEQQNLARLQREQAQGMKGLTDEVARAQDRVEKAARDVSVAQMDVPQRASAAEWAQRTGRQFENMRYPDIQKAMSDMQAKYADQPQTWEKMNNAAQAVFDYRKNLLQEKVNSGIIDQKTMDDLLATYKDWTPTRLLDYQTEEGPGGLARGNKVNVNSNGFKSYTLEGSNKAQENHVASLIREADQTYALGAKNRVFNGLVNAQAGEGGSLKRIADNLKEYVDTGGAAGPLHHPDYRPLPGQGEFKLTGFVNGKKQEYVTNNPYIKQAVDNVSVAPDPVATLASKATHLVRETAVSRNPLWLAGNSIIDAAGYSIGTTAAGGVRRNLPSMALNLAPALITAGTTSPDDPNRGHKIAAAAIAGMGTRALMGNRLGLGPSAMREFMLAYGDVLKGLGSGRMTGEGVRELEASGAGMRGGNFFGGGTKEAQKRLDELTRGNAFTIRNAEDAKKLANDALAFGWVKALGNRFEQAPRIAAYRVARQRGETQLEAMARARDVTIDFDRGGNFSKAMNNFIPFFNAGVQGGAQFGRLWRKNPGGMALAGASLVGMPTVAAEEWNRSDPQRSKDYDNVPQYLKDQGVVIMMPGDAPVDKNGNRVPQHIDINLREFAPFAIAAREAYDRTTGKGTPRNAGDLALASGQALQPLNVRNPSESITGVIPVPLSTAFQLGQNTDLYRGSTIANQFSDENASNFGKATAPILERALTSIPGQSADRIRPSQVDFATRDVFNGLGSSFLGASDVATGRAPRAPGLLQDIPVVGSELGRFVRGSGGQARQDVTSPEAMMAPDVRQKMRAMGDYYEPSTVPSDIQKIPLREAEQVQYQQLTNQYFDRNMRRYLDMPVFERSQAARDYLRAQAMTSARALAAAQVLREVRASGSNLASRYKSKSSAA
jgi:murein DD-endopeptidase MepM/ murein hydrolase activator NlpD